MMKNCLLRQCFTISITTIKTVTQTSSKTNLFKQGGFIFFFYSF